MKNDGRIGTRLTTGFVICVAGGLLAACSSNSNSGFNDPIEDALGDPLVAMGLKADPNKEEIEYGPRSPLVMPGEQPGQDLPTPMQAGKTEVLEPAWPKDPDAERKKMEAKMREAALQEKPRDVEYASEPMSPQELDEWGRMYGKTNGSGLKVGTKAEGKAENKVVDPRELLDRRKDPNQLRSEPPRQSLNEPPSGYRTPAPPVEGYEQPEKKKGFFSSWFGSS
jgi:hypothetical protein